MLVFPLCLRALPCDRFGAAGVSTLSCGDAVSLCKPNAEKLSKAIERAGGEPGQGGLHSLNIEAATTLAAWEKCSERFKRRPPQTAPFVTNVDWFAEPEHKRIGPVGGSVSEVHELLKCCCS